MDPANPSSSRNPDSARKAVTPSSTLDANFSLPTLLCQDEKYAFPSLNDVYFPTTQTTSAPYLTQAPPGQTKTMSCTAKSEPIIKQALSVMFPESTNTASHGELQDEQPPSSRYSGEKKFNEIYKYYEVYGHIKKKSGEKSNYRAIECKFCGEERQNNLSSMETHFLTKSRKYRCPDAPEFVREDVLRIKEERTEMNHRAKLKKAKDCKFEEFEKLSSLQKEAEQGSENLSPEFGRMHSNITGSASGPAEIAQSAALGESEMVAFQEELADLGDQVASFKKRLSALESVLASIIDAPIRREFISLTEKDLKDVEEAGRESDASDQVNFENCSR